jgi:sugar phosphate isomerase/epimerase
MRIAGAHLGYCTNIHAGDSWDEVRANLERHVVRVKERVAPREPMGVGLRLSGRAARELASPREMTALRRWLDAAGLYVFTINAFPYGAFHGARVKEDVYRPDWLEDDRVAYTERCADLLAALLPSGVPGSVSTVPIAFRARAEHGWALRAAPRIAHVARHLEAIEAKTGRAIALAIEPEPCCVVETIAEAIALFAGPLAGLSHVGLCLDTCHAAVEYEDVDGALAALEEARVPIAKVQLSCGLQIAPVDDAARAALAPFAEGVYLHQVVARRGDALARYVDLPDALTDARPADEWRVHFHVPIFRAALGRFAGTQAWLAALLARHRASPVAPHLEVETYTWDVLPAEFRGEPVEDAIARELSWVVERLR